VYFRSDLYNFSYEAKGKTSFLSFLFVFFLSFRPSFLGFLLFIITKKSIADGWASFLSGSYPGIIQGSKRAHPSTGQEV
jgi:hypothetical protein